MSIFSRVRDLLSANINAMLDKAEDPEKIARLIIQEMEDCLVEVRSAAARSMADKKEYERDIVALEASRLDWAGKAELAVENRSQWRPERLMEAAERLQKAARKRDSEAFYLHDLEFHRELWACTGNQFLTKALSQITIPLFAFWTLRHLRESDVDLIKQASAHERVALAIISKNKRQARTITREAMQLYLDSVDEDGVVLVHVSNRNLAMAEVAARAALAAGAIVIERLYLPEARNYANFGSQVVAIARTREALAPLLADGQWRYSDPPPARAWTDDYSNILEPLVRRIAHPLRVGSTAAADGH